MLWREGIMKLSGLKRFATKGLKHYYITTFFVFVLFIYTVLFYKSNLDLFGLDVFISFRGFLALAFSTITSLLIHEYLDDGKERDEDRFAVKQNGILMFALNALSVFFFYFYFHWVDTDIIPEFAALGRVLLMGYTILSLFLSVGRTGLRGYGRHLWRSLSSMGVAMFFSLILFSGLSFLALMINLLFELQDVDIYLNDYVFLAIVSAVLAFPLLFLSIYTDQKEAERHQASKEVDFVSRISLFYIVMPLLIVYTVVLYIYFFKQVFLLEFPNNVLAHLVVWFLFASHVALYFLSGISSYKNEFEKWVILNSRKFVPALLIPIALLFVSIGIRIYHYGFTEARYYLLLFATFNTAGLFLLYFFKWRAQFAIVVLSIVLLHLSLYGSLSASQVIYRSQMNTLDKVLAGEGWSLRSIMDGSIPASDVRLNEEVCYRVASSLEKIFEMNVLEYDSQEYTALKELQENGGGYLYSTRYYADGAELSKYIAGYYYNEVLELSDGEYLFRIRQGEAMQIGPFVVHGDYGGILFYPFTEGKDVNKIVNEERGRDLVYYFNLHSNVIADEAKNALYQDEFDYGDLRYEVFFFVEDFNYSLKEDQKIDDEYYNYYNFQILFRIKKGK